VSVRVSSRVADRPHEGHDEKHRGERPEWPDQPAEHAEHRDQRQHVAIEMRLQRQQVERVHEHERGEHEVSP
jgi:hypothetical protein